ncbi:selenium-dependent molybdenum cofactor biosynthesis protein YqeB [Sporohalobacter salinus]|uniref:selenium-dependent molybdenum cofactor biosynthesis protein YqeB n=1 Tax=Sporohalobacter salinus TaxID=1494606 RepID=UPI001960D4FE|nr:selenium-dependent molybdenum cofactor biosynthesis protein YqeB [Sporohalobacter salinus]MBM7623344.1 xanthine dehydrogenase accessory factor [Sporohalobacter salinus]
MFSDISVIVRGGGDLATGVIYTLYQTGFKVIGTEISEPLVVRRTVSFAEAIYEGKFTVEEVTANRVDDFTEIKQVLSRNEVPIVVDSEAEIIDRLQPQIVVDATMAKRNLGTGLNDAFLVIGLGPGFTAGEDVDVVIETNRGHDLGRIITAGQAESNTGIPGEVKGYSTKRVLKSPTRGKFITDRRIGDSIAAGEIFGYVDNDAIKAELEGMIRGVLKSGIEVKQGTKLGDIDPRNEIDYCYRISDKARAIGGAVLTAILSFDQQWRD